MEVSAKIPKPEPPEARPVGRLHGLLLDAVHERQHGHDHDDGSGSGPKNPAPPRLFDALLRWAHDLDWDTVTALKRAGVGRTVAKAIRDGTAGWPTATKIEEAVAERAQSLGRFTNRMEVIKAWADLGYAIATERPDLLGEMLDAARRVYQDVKKEKPPPNEAPTPPTPIEGIKRPRNR